MFAEMADPLNTEGLNGLSSERSDICTIEASCVTGFEEMAVEEVKQLLGCEAVPQRGRVLFDIGVSRVGEVARLRCVNTVWVMVTRRRRSDLMWTRTSRSVAGREW